MEEEGTLGQFQQHVTQVLRQNTNITLLKSTHPTDQLLLSSILQEFRIIMQAYALDEHIL